MNIKEFLCANCRDVSSLDDHFINGICSECQAENKWLVNYYGSEENN